MVFLHAGWFLRNKIDYYYQFIFFGKIYMTYEVYLYEVKKNNLTQLYHYKLPIYNNEIKKFY